MAIPRSRGLATFLVGILALIACKADKDAPASAPAPAPSGKAAVAAPTQPSLGSAAQPAPNLPEPLPEDDEPSAVPAAEPPVATTTPAQAFETEQRDPAWATNTERELYKRIDAAGGRIARAECRQRTCALDVSGSSDDVGNTIAKLESAKLTEFAQSIYLTAPVEENGTMRIRIVASFER